MRYSIRIACAVCLLIAASSKDESGEPYVPIDEISATETELIPDKVTKSVTATLQFSNLNTIDYLLVTKSGGTAYSERIERNELSPSYQYRYTIQASDPESLRLLFKAVYMDGNLSKELALDIDNRWGFFIRSVDRVARVTGTSMTGEIFPSPNNTPLEWNVGGTDLGI